MTQVPIPFHLLRGGTSRGPYFRRADLPQDRDALAHVLKAVIGSGEPRNVDGLGGGHLVTTKAAILGPSDEPAADVDFLFAQIDATKNLVDFGPTCGNILVGVGPAAIEMGLVEAAEGLTRVKIRAVNTNALVEAVVRTPAKRVTYDGDFAIDGVPGTAAPVGLNILRTAGAQTGALLPTNRTKEVIDDIEVTLMDVAMPMMIARAADFGLSGEESPAALNAMAALLARLETMRLEAGQRMGLGDVSRSVTPKVGLLSPPRGSGHVSARYLMPWSCHPTVAVTGSQCLAACALLPGTVADGLVRPIAHAPAVVTIEHPQGVMEVTVDYALDGGILDIRAAAVQRTARLIARGEVWVPSATLIGRPAKV